MPGRHLIFNGGCTHSAISCKIGKAVASTTPTPASLRRMASLIWWAFTDTQRFHAEEAADNEILKAQTKRADATGLSKLREGLWQAFLWCLGSLAVGVLAGVTAPMLFGAWVEVAIGTVIIGTLIILWGTLALQGWEIQTFGGVTLTERVNRWVFRLFYALGTAFIVAGSVWSFHP